MNKDAVCQCVVVVVDMWATPIFVNRFFAMKTPDECTPSEPDPLQPGVAVRKLKLSADETDGPCLSSPSAVDVESSSSAEDSDTDPPEPTTLLESIDCIPPPHRPPPPAKKQLQFPSTLEDTFGFSRAKRYKFEECVAHETSHGDDAAALIPLTPAEHSEPSTSLLDTLEQPSESMPSLSQTEKCSEFDEEDSECSHALLLQTNSYMSSEDFITTAASLEETSSTLHTSDLPDSLIGSSQDSREGESQGTVNMIDLTDDITDSSTSKIKQPSLVSCMLLQH